MVASPPSFVNFAWTPETCVTVNTRSTYPRHVMNPVIITVGSTLFGLLVAVPPAWAFDLSSTLLLRIILAWNEAFWTLNLKASRL